jgi:glycosyltransferase involved in cell wall biosynthesis
VKVVIIIPAYNESETLSAIIGDAIPHGQVIVVDDASSDDTADLAAEAGADVVRHQVNRGYDGALQSGFERAAEIGAEIAVTFDADGQHDPALLDRFIAPISGSETDMVIGVRPQTARVAEAVFGLYTNFRFGVPDILCGLKSYSMTLFHKHGRFDGTQSIGTELAIASLRSGARFELEKVPIRPRAGSARFGAGLKPNLRIVRAMGLAIFRPGAKDIGTSPR